MKNKIYLSANKIYEIDKNTTERFLIPSSILMENAGRAAAEFIKRYAKRKNLKKIIIFCGPGKNAGDGFVLARYLFIWNFDVLVVRLQKEESYKDEDVNLNYQIIKKLKIKIEEFSEKTALLIKKYNIVVDAIFGIGLKRRLEGIYEEAVKLINSSKKPVFCIDIPSGLDADRGEVLGCAVKADYTLSMGFLKKGFKNKLAKKYIGKVILLDIGYPKITSLI